MTRTKAKEKRTSETSSSSSMSKQDHDPFQVVVKEEIKEEVEDFTTSPRRKRKVIVKVVKVKVEHDDDDVNGDYVTSSPELQFKNDEDVKASTPNPLTTSEEFHNGLGKYKTEAGVLNSTGKIESERHQNLQLTLTPEEKRERKREAKRLYQQRRRAAMTAQQRLKEKEYQKQYRQKYLQMPAMELTELQRKLETCPEKNSEEFRRISQEKAELLREMKRKHETLRDKRLREKMTPEEFEEFKRKKRARSNECKRLSFQRRKKEFTPEQLEKRRQKRKEYVMKCMGKMSEVEKEERRRKRAIRTRMENLSEEAKARIRFRNYCRTQTKLAQMTEEEREEWTRRNTESARRWRESLPPERLEKHKELMRKRVQKRIECMDRDKYLKRQRINYKRYIRRDTPEDRQKRLRRYQVYAATRKLKNGLKKEGLPPQEIEKQVEDLKKKMWEEPLPPLETVSSYKPRPRRNPIYNDSDDDCQSQGDAITPFPKRRRGRPPGSFYNYRRRKQQQFTTSTSPHPETDTISMSPGFDVPDDFTFGNNHDHSLDSYGFHEDSSSVPATPLDSIVKDVQEPEVVVHFDLDCPHCPSIFPEKSDLLAHISSEHPNQCWKCPLCRSIMLSPTELQEHFKAEHSNTTGATNRRDTASTAAAHVTLAVNSAPLPPCEPVRPAASDNKATGVVPFQTPPTCATKSFKCIKCIQTDTAFECHEDLLEHFKSSHPESYWPCPKCNILKYTERSLNIHAKLCKDSSVPEKPPNPSGLLLDCRKCHLIFKSQKDLRIHVKYTHPQSYWLCLHCNEWKFSEKSLYKHKESCLAIHDSNSKRKQR